MERSDLVVTADVCSAVDGDTVKEITEEEVNDICAQVDVFIDDIKGYCDSHKGKIGITINLLEDYSDIADTIDVYARTLQYSRNVEVVGLTLISEYVQNKICNSDNISEIECTVSNYIQMLNVFDVIDSFGSVREDAVSCEGFNTDYKKYRICNLLSGHEKLISEILYISMMEKRPWQLLIKPILMTKISRFDGE